MLNIHTDLIQHEKEEHQSDPHTDDNHFISIKLYNRDSDLLAIHEAAKLIGSAQTPEYAINGMLRMMSQMLGLNRGRVLLTKDEQLKICYSYGLTPKEQQRGVYSPGEGITGKVISSGRLIVVENIDEEPNLLFRTVKRKTLPQEVVSYIALPIMDGATPIGVLACHRIRGRMRPIDADLVILRTFATFIGQTLKINRLLDTAKEQASAEINGDTTNAVKQQTIIGQSAAIKTVLKQVEQVADVDATVLLSGESGTGKECFARLLHTSSKRNDKPFIAINCAAIPEQLLEAELFGHERGAFTGALAKKQGKFELAHGGTLFLDEIGDLNADLQTKLLRVLENKSIQRVGGVKDIPIDVRIVTATHKNLMVAVNEGQFRLDLFYRLNVFPISLPALRFRSGDISLLAQHFLKSAKKEFKRHVLFEQGVLERLESYEWPGNIRQLENIIKRAVLMSYEGKIPASLIDTILASESQINLHQQNSILSKNELSVDTETNNTFPSALTPIADKPIETGSRPYSWVDDDEASDIRDALKRARGNKTQAAVLLGMTARQLRYRLSKLGIGE